MPKARETAAPKAAIRSQRTILCRNITTSKYHKPGKGNLVLAYHRMRSRGWADARAGRGIWPEAVMYSGAIREGARFTQRVSFLHGPVRGERVGVVDSNVFEHGAMSDER